MFFKKRCGLEGGTLSSLLRTNNSVPRSSSGRLLRLRGRGIEFDGIQGDQLVEIMIVIPTAMGDAEDALYKRLQEIAQDTDL